MWYNQTPKLTETELADLVAWFTYRMDQDTRGDLMAERPLQYAKLYPGVDPAAILRNVSRGVQHVANAQAEEHAVQADTYLARTKAAN